MKATSSAPSTALSDRSADELEIRNLLNRLANLTDEGDIDTFAKCFTDDATWEMNGAVWRGRGAIREGILKTRSDGRAGPGTASRHVVVNQVVRVESADRATNEQYLMFITDTATTPKMSGVWINQDVLRRTPQGWRLLQRLITKA